MNPEALKALREKDGLSVAAFAREVGTTPGHISNIEAGRRGAAPALTKRMATALAVPMSALLWHDEEADVPPFPSKKKAA